MCMKKQQHNTIVVIWKQFEFIALSEGKIAKTVRLWKAILLPN